jgi:hypothetical protein
MRIRGLGCVLGVWLAGAMICHAGSPGICERVARLENGGLLAARLVPGGAAQVRPAGPTKGEGEIETPYRVDIDNDGRLDTVTIARGEQSGAEDAILRLDDGPGQDLHDRLVGTRIHNGFLRVRFLVERRTTYLVVWKRERGAASDDLTGVWRLATSGGPEEICEFYRRPERVRSPREPVHPACEFVHAGKHSPTSANLDLDNDGTIDRFVIAAPPTDIQPICDWSGPVLVGEDGAKLPGSPVQRLLDAAADGCYGEVTRPFIFAGGTYLEHRDSADWPTEDHRVLQIRAGRLREVCAIDVRKQYYVPDDYDRLRRFAENNDWKDTVMQALSTNGGSAALDRLHRDNAELRESIADASEVWTFLSFGYIEDLQPDRRYAGVRWLLDHGVDAGIGSGSSGDSFLDHALSDWSDARVAMLLVKRGADTEAAASSLTGYDEEEPGRGDALFRAIIRRERGVPAWLQEYARDDRPALFRLFAAEGFPLERKRDDE